MSHSLIEYRLSPRDIANALKAIAGCQKLIPVALVADSRYDRVGSIISVGISIIVAGLLLLRTTQKRYCC